MNDDDIEIEAQARAQAQFLFENEQAGNMQGASPATLEAATQDVINGGLMKGSYDTTMGNLKGIANAGLGVVTAPADLLYRGGNYLANKITGNEISPKGYYPSDMAHNFIDWASGYTGDKRSEDVANLVGTVATASVMPQQAGNIAKSIPVLSKLAKESKLASLAAKAIGYGTEGGAYGLFSNPKGEDLLDQAVKGAALNTMIPATVRAGGSVLKSISSLPEYIQGMFSPAAKAETQVAKVIDELQTISPTFATEALTPAQRTMQVAQGLETAAKAEGTAAGSLFEALPNENVVLDPAIANTRAYAEDVGSILTPGSTASNVVRQMERLSPQASVVETPASTILNEFGQPVRAATREFIPAGPTVLPLKRTQDVLRDIGKAGERTTGVDQLITNEAKSQVLQATKESVSPEAFNALQEARATWAQYKNDFDRGAVGKVRNILKNPEAPIERFKNFLFKAKGSEQLAKVMTPEELIQAQHIMLADVFTRQPAAWAKRISEKADSFNNIFGGAHTQELLTMLSRDGSVGKTLLQDNQGLKNLLGKLVLKSAGGAVLGGALGGEKGALLGAALGAGSSAASSQAISRVQSLLMRASAGDPEILALLSAKAAPSAYPKIIDALVEKLTPTFSKAGIAGLVASEAPKRAASVYNDMFTKPEAKSMPEDKKASPKITQLQTSLEKLPVSVSSKLKEDPFKLATAIAESNLNPEAKNPNSSAKGLFQFINSTARSVGLDNPYDAEQSLSAFDDLTEGNRAVIKSSKPEDLYGAHVLGAGLYKRVMLGKTITDPDEQALVDYWYKLALPNFKASYKKAQELI